MKKTFTMRTLCGFGVVCSAAVASPPSVLADSLSMNEMPGSSYKDVEQAAKDTVAGTLGLVHSSSSTTKKGEGILFEKADFVPQVSSFLAILSDDGCNVAVTGPDGVTKTLDSAFDQGQALSDTGSLHKLDGMVLKQGVKYQIKVRYSNTTYTGDGDIDGFTLFAYADPSLTDAKVIISSDIETSYHKDASSPSTPGAYINQQRVMSKRGADNSITVDSVVSLLAGLGPLGTDSWVASTNLSAATTVFPDAGYAWEEAANQGTFSSPLPGISSSSTVNWTADLGTASQGYPKSSTFTVTAKESRVNEVPYPNGRSVTSASYTVRWHRPVEEWKKDPLSKQPVPVWVFDTEASDWGKAGQPLDITYHPENISAKAASEVISGVLGVASAGTGLAAVWTGTVSAGISTFLAAASVAVAANAPDPRTVAVTTDYDQWAKAVAAQKKINSGGAASGDAVDKTQRVFPADLADTAVLHPEDSKDDLNWDLLQTHCILARREQTDLYTGDRYDKNGFAGPEFGHLTWQRNPSPVWQFKKVDVPVLPAPGK